MSGRGRLSVGTRAHPASPPGHAPFRPGAHHCERKRRETAPGGPCGEAGTDCSCSEHKGLLRACGRGARERLCTAIRVTAAQRPAAAGGPREAGLAPGWGRSNSNELTSEGRLIRKGLRFNKLAELFGRKFWLSNSKACFAVTVPSRGLSGAPAARCEALAAGIRGQSSAGRPGAIQGWGTLGSLPPPAPVAVSARARTHTPSPSRKPLFAKSERNSGLQRVSLASSSTLGAEERSQCVCRGAEERGLHPAHVALGPKQNPQVVALSSATPASVTFLP